MVRLNLLIISHDGEPQIGKTNQITIQLSVDGAPFSTTSLTATEIGNGCYYVDIPDSSLTCQYNVLIRATCPDCQDTVFEYRPDTELDTNSIASAVWTYTNGEEDPSESRTLTAAGGDGSLTAAEVWRYHDRTLTSGNIHVNAPTAQEIANKVWERRGGDTTSRTLTEPVTVSADSIASIQSGLSHFDPDFSTVTLGSINVGSEKIATESYVNSVLVNGEWDDTVNPGLIAAAIQALSTKIDTLPKEIWGRGSGDTTSRTLTTVAGLGIAADNTVRTLIGENNSTGNSLAVKDVEGNTTISFVVTLDSNNQIISIR